jgi:hypothetical protein
MCVRSLSLPSSVATGSRFESRTVSPSAPKNPEWTHWIKFDEGQIKAGGRDCLLAADFFVTIRNYHTTTPKTSTTTIDDFVVHHHLLPLSLLGQ